MLSSFHPSQSFTPATSQPPVALDARLRLKLGEHIILRFLQACALLSVLTTIGIIGVLVFESWSFFQEVSVGEFFLGTTWAPLIDPRHFGVVPLVTGTLLVSLGACVIAVPLGLGSAIFLAEYAPSHLRSILKPLIELLAGIPSVVYGYFALTTVTPLLQSVLPQTEVFNAASASIVLGFMVLPTIASLCDDAFRAIPRSLREGGYALGATKMEVSLQVIMPSALSGIIAAFILAFSRAIGETMAVTLAAGSTPNLTFNPLQTIQTMTAYIVQVSMGDTPHGTIEYQTIFAVAAYLFLITLGMNLISFYVLKKYRRSFSE